MCRQGGQYQERGLVNTLPPTARLSGRGASDFGGKRTNGANLECGSHKMDLLLRKPRFPHCPPYKLSSLQRLSSNMYIWRLGLDKFARVGVFN